MAPRSPALTVVKDDRVSEGPVGAVVAAARSTRSDLLRALRDRIAADIDAGVPARDLASLSKRLLDISKELADLEGAADDDVSDAAATPDEAYTG